VVGAEGFEPPTYAL